MEPGGSGFCRERSPFMRDFNAEWHYRQAGFHHYHHQDHHARMYLEKMEPGSSSDLCGCYSCSSSMMHRHPARPPHGLFPEGPECFHQVKEFGGAKACPENSSPCFSIRTPLRRDSPATIQNDSPCNAGPSSMPARVCMGYNTPNSSFMGYHKACPPKPCENQINLHKWFLMKLKEEHTCIALGGYLSGYDNGLVTTGPIADRIEKTRLRTRDGMEIRLSGCIDEETTIANGFSSPLSQLFLTGFPCTWKNALQDGCIREENLENVSTPVAEKKLQTSPDGDQGSCPETPAPSIPGVAQAIEEGVINEAIHPGEPASPPRSEKNPDESAAEDHVETPVAVAADDPPVAKRSHARKRAASNRLPTRCSKRLNKGKEKDAQESDGSNDSREKKCEDEEVVEEAVVVEKFSFTLKMPEPVENENNEQQTQKEEELVVHPEAEVVFDRLQQQQAGPLASSRKRPRRAVSRSSRKRKVTARKIGEAVEKENEKKQGENETISVEKENEKQGENETIPEKPQVSDATPEPGIAENLDPPEKNWVDEALKASDTEKELELEEVEVVEVEVDLPEPEDEVPEVKEENNNNKRVIRRRASRARKTTTRSRRKQRKDGEQKERSIQSATRAVPVVQVDSDDQPEHKPTVASKQSNSRTKRSALPPPLPASRVVKSEVIEAYGLKTSRSGRLLVPPLAYWRNQTLALDKDGGIIAIMDGFAEPPSDTGVFNFKPPSEKKQLQEKLCAAASADNRSSIDRKGKKKVRGSK